MARICAKPRANAQSSIAPSLSKRKALFGCMALAVAQMPWESIAALFLPSPSGRGRARCEAWEGEGDISPIDRAHPSAAFSGSSLFHWRGDQLALPGWQSGTARQPAQRSDRRDWHTGGGEKTTCSII